MGDRGLDWAEAPVSGGDVNLDKKKTKTEIKGNTISMGWPGWTAHHKLLRVEVLRMDPRGVCCPSSQSGQLH